MPQCGWQPNNEAKRLTAAAGTRIALLHPDMRAPFLTEVLVATLNAASVRSTQLLLRNVSGIGVDDADVLVTQALAVAPKLWCCYLDLLNFSQAGAYSGGCICRLWHLLRQDCSMTCVSSGSTTNAQPMS